MPEGPPPGSTPTGYQRTQGGGVAWSPPSAAHLEQLLPQYHVECLLGRGGMGAVYKGLQKSLERPVAIKILPPDLDDADASYTQRFKNEAKLMAKMNHPAIVHVYDYGVIDGRALAAGRALAPASAAGTPPACDATRDDGDGSRPAAAAGGPAAPPSGPPLFYFVMEFVNGTDVQQMIQAQGRLPPEHALAVTAHVCDALKYAHEHGVIHRDIKPANVLINMEGAVKVADFGLAKASDGGTTGITKTGMAMGTPDYVAPEALVMGVDVDARADVYAVGVMLYTMLTGHVPRGAFKPPSVMVPGVDRRFDAIVERAMQMNRDERYPGAAHIRRDLDAILTAPQVQAGGQSSAAVPRQVVAQKPVSKGPQKPMGKSANVPVDGRRVRQNAEEAAGTPDRTLASAPTGKSKTPLLIGIGAVAAIAVGAFVMMGGEGRRVRQNAESAATSSGIPSGAAQLASSPTSSAKPIKVREEPKPAVAPISNSKSPISNPAPAKPTDQTLASSPTSGAAAKDKFPPGQWVKVFTKFEDLPAESRRDGKRWIFDNGWLQHTPGVETGITAYLEEPMFKNVGVRARVRAQGRAIGSVTLRRPDNNGPLFGNLRFKVTRLGDGQGNFVVDYVASENSTSFTELVSRPFQRSATDEETVEYWAYESKLFWRLADQPISTVKIPAVVSGRVGFYGDAAFRDIEVINLDGIPEAEAMKLIGVDEKGNDLRGAGLAGRAAGPPAAASGPAMTNAGNAPAPANAALGGPSALPSAGSASSSPSPPVSKSSAEKFPAGKWVDITEPYLRDNPTLQRGSDGWIKVVPGNNKKPDVRWTNGGVRLSRRWELSAASNQAQISLNGPTGQFNLSLDNSPRYRLWKQAGANTDLLPTPSLSKEDYQGIITLELVRIGDHLAARVNQRLHFLALKPDQLEATVSPHTYFGSSGSSIRDIEVINLDGIPEAEALRILGVDDKGNDTRAAALAAEKKALEQQRMAQTINSVSELADLQKRMDALTQERVTGPFEAGIKQLDASYSAALDREIAPHQKAGDLDAVLAMQNEKKRVAAGEPLLGDDTTDPPALKPLRNTYRTAVANLDATRADSQKTLTEQYDAALKKLETDLTKQNRIQDAATVRAVRESLGKPSSAAEETPKTAPPKSGLLTQTKPTTAKKGKSAKYSPNLPPPEPIPAALTEKPPRPQYTKELAAWALSLPEGSVRIRIGKQAKGLSNKNGDKLPAEKFELLNVEVGADLTDKPDIKSEWLLGQTDLENLRLDGSTFSDFSVLRGMSHLSVLSLRPDGKAKCGVNRTPEAFRQLPLLPAVKRLFMHGPIGDEGVRIVCERMPSLDDLGFQESGKITTLAPLQRLGSLKRLELRNEASFARCLNDLAPLPNLEKLELAACMAKNATDWESISTLANLRELIVGFGSLPSAEALSAMKLSQLPHLEKLSIEYKPEMGGDSSGLGTMPGLVRLDLHGTNKPKSFFSFVMSLPPQPSLQEMRVTDIAEWTDDDFAKFAERYAGLKTLDVIASRSLTDKAVQSIADKMPGLTKLVMHKTPVTDAVAVPLRSLRKLEELEIGGPNLTPLILAELKHMKNLKKMRIATYNLPQKAVDDFKKARPDIDLNIEVIR
ncbi:MAG: protein kinase [Verrucomicrobiaceae bacterium]|nr:protein kinase [Verrucomicrobiaceae bacterium]